MPYVNPSTLTLTRHDRTLTAQTPFWSVTHDLDRGGAPVEIRFVHGGNDNVLAEPLSTRVDRLSDARCPDTAVEVRETPGCIELTFDGRLHDEEGRPATAAFRTVYRYSPYWVRREVQLTVPAETRAAQISPLGVAFDDRFTHWSGAHDPRTKPARAERVLGPHYDQEDGEIPSEDGVFFRDARPPGWMSLYQLGGAGVQIAPAGDLTAWDAPTGEAGSGAFELSRRGDRLGMAWEALSGDEEVPQPQQRSFAAFISLANLPEMRSAPLRTVMVGNPPFPSDDLLQVWADSGVELIVIMEGANWTDGSDRFWRTGVYPCYRDERDMRDLDRLIRSVHALGLKVIPYTCPTELHPEMPTFAANAREWHRAAVPNGQAIYHAAGKSPGGCYGAMMCPDSAGWRRFYLDYVNTLLTKHDFDGVYVDIVWKAPCYNTAHGPAHHGGLDGLWGSMGAIRESLGPDRLMVIHNGESVFLATSNNLADMIVTLEGISWFRKARYDLDAIARIVRAFPACAVSLVPCSTWYRVQPPHPKQMGLRDGIAKGLLLGAIPYSYAMWETRWGYQDNEECLVDPRGLYAAFRELKSLSLEGLRFEDCFSDAVRTNRKGVRGARYAGDDRQVVLIANVAGRDVKDVRWRCGEARGTIPALQADEYRFIELTEGRSCTG